MSRKVQFGVLAFAAVLLVGAGIANLALNRNTDAKVAESQPIAALLGEVGSQIAEFSVTDINGKTLSADDLRGRVLLVDYWATWCKPCEIEMPGYQRLLDKYRDRGLVVIGISFDGNMQMSTETVEHYAARVGIRYPLVLDNPELQKHFGGIRGLPTTLLIDRNRRIRFKVVGFEYTDKVEAALLPLF